MEVIILGLDKAALAKAIELEKYLNTPITTYTHTTNKEVVVSAVDVSTDTFTSVAHGLVNGDRVSPLLNYDAGNVYALNVYAGGLSILTAQYYVVNKTNDTFQLSLTNGGTAIDLTTNANMDLAKWHFETNTANITISSLPNLSKCKIKLFGRSLIVPGGAGIVCVNSLPVLQEYIVNLGNSFDYATLSLLADYLYKIEVDIDYTKFLTIKAKGMLAKSNNATTNTVTMLDKIFVSPKYRDSAISSVTFNTINMANRNTIEVYKA
jgi:hypothetical protein